MDIMNNKPPFPLQKLQGNKIAVKPEQLQPQVRTLEFIRLFARNYQLEPRLPEGLREINTG